MANLKVGGDRGNQTTGGKSSMETLPNAITIDRAAELSGSTPASIKRAKPIVQSGIPGRDWQADPPADPVADRKKMR